MATHSRRQGADNGPLFGGPDLWAPLDDRPPHRPLAAAAEQREMPIPGTLEARYQRWRQTDDGRRIYSEILRRALYAVGRGERRIGVKAIAEQVRADLHLQINNTLVALIAREMHDTAPALRDLIELRERSTP